MIYTYDGFPQFETYAQLREHFDRQKPFRGSEDRPFGSRKYNNRRMRMLDDESIELQYYEMPLIRYHPDGEVSVKAFNRRVNGYFPALPKQMQCGMATRSGPVLYLFDEGEGFWLRKEKPKEEQRNQWDTHNFERNTAIRVLRCEDWVRFHYCAGVWQPVDEMQITPIQWYEPDKTRTRKVSAEYNIPDFVNAAKAIIALGADDQEAAYRRWRSPAWEKDAILEALKDKDFGYVMKNIRRQTSWTYDAKSGQYNTEITGVSSTDITALRDRVYVITGICEVKSERMVQIDDFNRIERQLKKFGHPDR